MTVMFDKLHYIHRLEEEGFTRSAAELIAHGVEEARHNLATKADLEPLATKADLQITPAELELKMTGTAHRQTIQFGIMMSAGLAIAVAAIGVIVSAH